MIKTILMPTDFSIEAQELLHCVEQLKRVGLKKIIFLHVIDVVHTQGLTPMFEKHDKEKLEECKQFAEEAGLKAEVLVKKGNIPKTIVQTADQKKADCIAMGSTTGGIIKALLLGSTTEYVARKPKKIVLIEKYNYLKKYDYKICKKLCAATFDKMLVPIDFSKESLEAVNKLNILDGKRKQVILAHVIEKSKTYSDLKKQKTDALKKLKKIGKKMKEFKIKHYVVEGVPSDEINKLAIEQEVSIIVMTSKGGGLAKDILFGSTTENLLRKTSYPMLIIHSNNQGDLKWQKNKEN